MKRKLHFQIKYFVVFLLLLAAASSFAQELKTVSAPVTVTVEKPVVTPGSAAQITGTSVPLGDNKTVKIAITTPEKDKSGKLVTESLNGILTAQGTYKVSFDKTKTPGAYNVTATSPDGKSTAKAKFNVVSAQSIESSAKRMNSSMVQLAGKSEKTIQAVKAAIDAKENFPDRQQMDQDLAKVEQAFSQLPKQMAGINKALDQLSGLVKEYPGLANVSQLAQVAQELTVVCDEADEMIKQSDVLLAHIPKSNKISVCDRMDAAIEALNFTGKVFDFYKAVPKEIGKYLIDFAATEMISKSYDAVIPVEKQNANHKLIYEQSVKNVKALFLEGSKGFTEYLITPTDLVFDATKLIVNAGFGHLCERFVGPIEGVFSVDATDGGSPFWGYKTYIKGRLILRFETKNNTGRAPVPMTGEFEGTAIKFEVYEDLFTGNPTNKRSVLYRQIVKPFAGGDIINWMAVEGGGAVPSTAMTSRFNYINYFKVPVTGALAADGNSVAIEVAQAATIDFKTGMLETGLKATAYYVSLPQGTIIPIVQTFDIPMQSAQFILSRGLRSPATIKVKTEKLPKGQLVKMIDQTFTRTEDLGDVKVNWNLKVKACSPNCP